MKFGVTFLVKVSVCYVFQGSGVRLENVHRTSRQKRCERQKLSRKFLSAGAWHCVIVDFESFLTPFRTLQAQGPHFGSFLPRWAQRD